MTALWVAALLALAPRAMADEATVREALAAELERSKTLDLPPDHAAPYLVIYDALLGEHATYHAAFGSMLSENESAHRQLRVEVRMGNYLYDSSNFDALGEPDGVVTVGLPIEDSAGAIQSSNGRRQDRKSVV